jgi:hypothetical protein
MTTDLIINKNELSSLVQPTTVELICILMNQDNIELAHYEGQMNLEKAVEGTTLRKLSKVIHEKNLAKTIVFLINRLSSNFNVGKNFTNDQAVTMAFDLIDVFGYETIEDILLMFKLARTGQIGDGKDFKLDSQTVFHKWIPQYLELKAEFREKKHNASKDITFKNNITIEQVHQSYAKIKFSGQKREDAINAKIDEITKGFTREMLENLILEWQQDKKNKKFLRYLTKRRLSIKD